MSVSATAPIGQAFDHVKSMLFQPFEARKWFVVGFSAFLATLGSGGGSNFRVPDFGSGGSSGGDGSFESALDWVRDNLQLILVIGIAVLVVALTLGLTFAWLSARGKFVFLDNVVRNEAAIKRPWREYAQEGNRLFVFNVVLGFGTLLVVALSLTGAALIAWADIEARTLGTGAMVALGIAVLVVLPLLVLVAVINGVMQLWGIPLMYLRRVGAMAGLRAAFSEIVFPHLGSVIVFWLLLALLGMGAALLGLLVILFTCCLGALPYINSVLMLPVTVLFRCLPLYFMEQIGQEFRIFNRLTADEVVDVFR